MKTYYDNTRIQQAFSYREFYIGYGLYERYSAVHESGMDDPDLYRNCAKFTDDNLEAVLKKVDDYYRKGGNKQNGRALDNHKAEMIREDHPGFTY